MACKGDAEPGVGRNARCSKIALLVLASAHTARRVYVDSSMSYLMHWFGCTAQLSMAHLERQTYLEKDDWKRRRSVLKKKQKSKGDLARR